VASQSIEDSKIDEKVREPVTRLSYEPPRPNHFSNQEENQFDESPVRKRQSQQL
jgi:hypothetical protein